MPTYEYVSRDPQRACKHCRDPFEVRQSMRDAPLRACPRCGAPLERLISACAVNTRSEKSMLSDRNLREKGFSKFVKEGEGRYRKVN